MSTPVKTDTVLGILDRARHADATILYPMLKDALKQKSEERDKMVVNFYTEPGRPPVVATFYGATLWFCNGPILFNELLRVERKFNDTLNLPTSGLFSYLSEFRHKTRLEELDVEVNRLMFMALATVDLRFSGYKLPARRIAQIKLKIAALLAVWTRVAPAG